MKNKDKQNNPQKNQITINFTTKTTLQPVHPKKNVFNNIIEMNPRKEIYRRILNRRMK